MKNIFSIDVESWVHFYLDALKIKQGEASTIQKESWDNHYIHSALADILNLLQKYNQKATFFVIAEIYNWYPELIREIKARGHEIGYHTHSHNILKDAGALKAELNKSTDFIKEFKPVGFRAPQIYITPDSLQLLSDYGFKYSSSSYGEYNIEKINGIDEIPVSSFCFRPKKNKYIGLPKNLTAKMLCREIPFGSGFFIALLGSRIFYFVDQANKNNAPAILFIHPWQLYKTVEISGFSFGMKILKHNPACLPYMINISETLERLFNKYQFISFKEYYGY